MNIGIIGGGVVGSALARSYVEWGTVRVFDLDPAKRTHPREEVLSKSELTFVCLPTHRKEYSYACNTSYIERFFKEVKEEGYGNKNFVLRSTVPIGMTRKILEDLELPNLVHSPEFLTARCSFTDAQIPSRNIIGVPYFDACLGTPAYDALYKLYERRFPQVAIHCMDSNESEAVKLMLNSFFAVKLAYFNEVRVLADRLGLDWERVMGGILSDGRIAHSHTQVPGHDGLAGWGGTCVLGDALVEVTTATGIRGQLTIQELKPLVDKGESLQIRSTNHDCSKIEQKQVTDVIKREYEGELLEFEVSGKKFVCTPDHLIPVYREDKLSLVRACEVSDSDKLMVDHETQS